jgi:Glycosyl hydrolases family 28/Pectate lyase superfamily protein
MLFVTKANTSVLLSLQGKTLSPLRFAIFLSLIFIIPVFGNQKKLNTSDAIDSVYAPFEVPQFHSPIFSKKVFDIRNFGAKSGGKEKNTIAIQNTIETATKAGGGIVLIPAGTWLTGAIHLEDNVNLFLAKNAELLFSQDPKDYLPAVFSRHEGTECYKFSSFIYANGKKNIAISGQGILNGQGKPWWKWKDLNMEQQLHEMGAKGIPVSQRIFDGRNGKVLRPAFFQPVRCSNVLVEGVSFLYGAFWTIAPVYCENVIVRDVKIVTSGEYGITPNGDGVDPSSCKDVLIEHCEFNTGDDCIAIKSGRGKDGLRVAIPTENVIVRHCTGLRGHGGIVIGSETAGGIRNIFAFDCHFNGTERIVRIKTARGRGGALENMWFNDLSADTIKLEALRINMLYTGTRLPAEPVTSATPRIRNIHYANITCLHAGGSAIEIWGLPEMPVTNVTFDSLSISAATGFSCADANLISLTNVSMQVARGPVLSITDGKNIIINHLGFNRGSGPLVSARGKNTEGIALEGTDTTGANGVVEYGKNVSHSAVTLK